jgi:hypothetical protein
MSEHQENDKQRRSLREQILYDIPPSGLKLDGNLTVRECEDILDYLEREGHKSIEAKIAYIQEMTSTSGDDYLNDLGVTPATVDQVKVCIKGQKWLADSTRQLSSITDSVRSISASIEATQKILSGPLMETHLKEVQERVIVLNGQTQYLTDQLQFVQYLQSYQKVLSDILHHLSTARNLLVHSQGLPELRYLRDQWQHAFLDINTLSGSVNLIINELERWRTARLSADSIELIKPPEQIEEDLRGSRQDAEEWQQRLAGPEYRENPEEDLRQANQVIGILLARIELLEMDVEMWKRLYKEISAPKPLEDDRDYRYQ